MIRIKQMGNVAIRPQRENARNLISAPMEGQVRTYHGRRRGAGERVPGDISIVATPYFGRSLREFGVGTRAIEPREHLGDGIVDDSGGVVLHAEAVPL